MSEIRVKRRYEGSLDPVTDLNPFPVAIMQDEVSYSLPNTFRVAFSFAAVSGDALELVGHDTRVMKILEVAVTKPTAQSTIILIRRAGADTAGTSTNATIASMDSNDSAAAVCKLYTVAPTAGITAGDLARFVCGTTDTIVWTFDRPGTKPPTLRAARETFVINTNATATLVGWIEWTEELRE